MEKNDVPIVTGFHSLCELPKALGDVEDLYIKKDKLVAKTTSGVLFIVPTGWMKEDKKE